MPLSHMEIIYSSRNIVYPTNKAQIVWIQIKLSFGASLTMSIIGFIYVIHRSFLGSPIFYLKAMFLLYISKLVLRIISTLNNIRENVQIPCVFVAQ
jgi:hypothetical protein